MTESSDSKRRKIKYPSKAAEFEDRIARLKEEGKMPTFYQLLGAMKKGAIAPPKGESDA